MRYERSTRRRCTTPKRYVALSWGYLKIEQQHFLVPTARNLTSRSVNSLLLLSRQLDLAMLLVFVAGWEVLICHEPLFLGVIARILNMTSTTVLASTVANPQGSDSMSDEHTKSASSDTCAQSQKRRDDECAECTAKGVLEVAVVRITVATMSVWAPATTASLEGQFLSGRSCAGAGSSDERADTGNQEVLVAHGPSAALSPRELASWGCFDLVLDKQEGTIFYLDHIEIDGIHGNRNTANVNDAEMDNHELCASFVFWQLRDWDIDDEAERQGGGFLIIQVAVQDRFGANNFSWGRENLHVVD